MARFPHVGLGFQTHSDGVSDQWMSALLLFLGDISKLLTMITSEKVKQREV